MTYILPKLLSFEEFIAQYGDNTRYELIDGELRDMEPTGLHELLGLLPVEFIWKFFGQILTGWFLKIV